MSEKLIKCPACRDASIHNVMDSVCYMCGDTHKVKPTSAAVYLVMFGHMGPTRVGQETRERAIKLFRVGPHFVHRKWHPLVRIELEHGFHPKN